MIKIKRQSSRQKFGHFEKKLMVYYCFVSTIVDPLNFEGGPRAIAPMPSFSIQPQFIWDPQFFS